LIGMLRQKEDGQTGELMDQLRELTFTTQDSSGREYVNGLHRAILNEAFIEKNPKGYVDLHKRAYTYWERQGFDQTHTRLIYMGYHAILGEADVLDPFELEGIPFLLQVFHIFADEYLHHEIENFLTILSGARPFLEQLNCVWLSIFDDMLSILRARQLQLAQEWALCETELAKIITRKDVTPVLAPYILRTQGDIMAHYTEFVGAMDVYRETLKRIENELRRQRRRVGQAASGQISLLESEKRAALLALGDAHVGLAIDARGDLITRLPNGKRGILWAWLTSALSLPIILYLFTFFGSRVFRPAFWLTIGREDWQISRLFALGYRHYRQAESLILDQGRTKEKIALNERFAQLFLQLGDWRAACAAFQRLRQEELGPLGEYQHAQIALGLAEAELRSGHAGRAYVYLQEALPIFERYSDSSLQTRTHALLGQVWVKMGEPSSALNALGLALRGYETEEDWVSATNLAEYIDHMLADGDYGGTTTFRAQNLVDSLLTRQYTFQYVHPGLNRLRLTFLVAVTLFVMLLPLLVIDIQELIIPQANAIFMPDFLLDLDQIPQIPQSNTSQSLIENWGVNIVDQLNIGLRLPLAFIATALLDVGLLLGALVFIVATPVDSVQASSIGKIITLDHHGIKIGDSQKAKGMAWADIKRMVKADIGFLPRLPMFTSGTGLFTEKNRLIIRGNTNWYPSLQKRLERQLEIRVANISRVLLLSPLVIIFGIGGLIPIGLTVLALLDHPILTYSLAGTPYRLIDLYPFSFAIILLPIFWWLVVLRWRQKIVMRPRDFWPWSLLITAGLVTAWQILVATRPLLTVPDIYPPLFAAGFSLFGSTFILFASVNRRPVYSLLIRLMVVLLALVLFTANIGRVSRDLLSYDYLISGKGLIREAMLIDVGSSRSIDRAKLLFDSAAEAFAQSKALSQWPIPLVGEERAVFLPYGIPQTDDMISVQADIARASILARQNEYEESIVSYSDLGRVLQSDAWQAQLNGW
ncbi:MAG: hypothetical protein AAF633_22905, partial [Chloroflexota bacterium]